MGKVYVVHCVDTEGPLNESLEATFQRIKQISGLELEASNESLKKIQKGEIKTDDGVLLSDIFSKRLLSYNRDWSELDKMLYRITSDEFRNRYRDSKGIGWKYTWFIMDHIGYNLNPRNKIVGYNAIWDHYQEFYRLNKICNDEFQWHAHPASVYNEGNRCGTSYINSPHILQSLAHRLIDRGFFPTVFRPGYHTERPDSHWLLEQYIPYDYSNQAIRLADAERKQQDLSGGRFGDWRRAPYDWSWYHPSHDDYQTPGQCRRTIFRCLNAGTRLRLITQEEVNKAFKRAESGQDTIIAFCDHDFREMSYDVDDVYNLICRASEQYPNIVWEYATAFEAAKRVLNENPKDLMLRAECHMDNGRQKLVVTTKLDTFGPQPFFAVKRRNGEYRVENLDVQEPNRKWSYVFDEDSIHPDEVICFGIASNSKCGSGSLYVGTLNNKTIYKSVW